MPLCRGRSLGSRSLILGGIRPETPNVGRFMTTQPIGDSKHLQDRLPRGSNATTHQRFREFDLQGKVYAVTGGGRGLGLAMAEALVEAGAQGITGPALRCLYAC